MKRVYIGLGSNLGAPEQQIGQAVNRLANLLKCQDPIFSPWYRTSAVGGPPDQPDYLNAVCRLQTDLTPEHLLRELQAIETQAGRVRTIRWGPRTLDLDIIWYQQVHIDTPTLTLPHPRAHLRAFVLQPLLDLGADFLLQGTELRVWRDAIVGQAIVGHEIVGLGLSG
ncbi:2-amino-4-hydroxy-6-hydroxymethyldihydropteridine diphosphokinase [Reinekea sp.]|uniref:2-amino-4-hydroxy-6- hydroxymethyldihydropteridine diphosphokinase n=1 Tax=Reinekea sp. TaxID=1970455 RepID=UPI002A83F4B6|nr:2-amino-4-hydroxy-6-hydroxymethyldihydropteridine diphosphokinase [Reinekea sp.]